jgi:hypothetical protein
MSKRRTVNGRWVVLILLAAGVIAGVVGLIVRKFPEGRGGVPTSSATTQADGRPSR